MVLCKAILRLLSGVLCTIWTVYVGRRCRLERVQRNYARLASFLMTQKRRKFLIYVRGMKAEALFPSYKKP